MHYVIGDVYAFTPPKGTPAKEKEIYPFTMEERIKEQMPEAAEELQKAAAQALDKRHAEYLKKTCRKEIKSRLSGKRV